MAAGFIAFIIYYITQKLQPDQTLKQFLWCSYGASLELRITEARMLLFGM